MGVGYGEHEKATGSPARVLTDELHSPIQVGAAGVADSTLSTIDHDLHRVRRSAIAPFFSSQNVRKLEPVIQAKVDLLFRRLATLKDVPGDVNLSHAFSAFTNGRSYPNTYLAIPLCVHG